MSVPVKQSVPINFAGGINTKDDPWQIQSSEFLALNNMVYTTGGRLTKRNGFPASFTKTVNSPNPSLTLSVVPGTLSAARKVFSYADELLLNDAWNLYSYDVGNSAWNYKGRSTQVSLSTDFIVANSTAWAQADSSIDTTSGIKVFAYCFRSTVQYSIQDISTGQILVNQAVMGASGSYKNCRCVSISGKSWILAVNVSDGKIYYQAIVGQTVTGSPTVLISNLNQTYTFTVSAANATAGATYTNSGNTFTVLSTIAGGTTLVTSGGAVPAVSGTLTKASGTGDATITYSEFFSTSGSYDVDVDPNTGNIYIAYYNSSQGITISALSSSLVVGNTITKAGESGTNGVSWFGDGTNIWVTYASTTAVKTFVVNNAVSSTTAAPTTIDSTALAAAVNNITGVWSSVFSKAFFFYDPVAVNGFNNVTSATINYNTATLSGSTITPGTANRFIGSLSISSKAFAVSGIPHLVGWFGLGNLVGESLLPSIIQPTNFLLNIYNLTPSMGGATNNGVIANIAAKISPDEAQITTVTAGILAGVHQNGSGPWDVALLQNNNYGEAAAGFLAPTGVINCSFDFTLSNTDGIDLGSNAIFAGGQVSMYDGASTVEQNFHIYPSASTYSLGNSGAMGLASSNCLYSWIFTYEWIDNKGQIHRSSPSPAVTPLDPGFNYTFSATTVNGSATFSIRTLRVTAKSGSQVQIVAYRTVANGSVYFRIGQVLNDPSVDTVTYSDGQPDAGIIGNIQLYTTGGLEYYAPAATNALTSFKNRGIAVASEDPYQFNYSNQVQQNFPVQFVPEFLQNIGTVGGPLVTIAQVDDKMILFKGGTKSGPAIYYMVGQGPAPSGAGNDFQDPLPIAVDVGCVDRPSVVLTPVGLMFKSDKGIYLIDRGLQATYIGAPVESYNQYSVVAAQLIPNSTQVRFSLSSGTMLMYDYFYKKWATWTPPAVVSDCIFRGKHTIVDAAGQVYQETVGTYYDGVNTPVLQGCTTAWIRLSELQNYIAAYFFYLLGEWGTGNSSIAMTLNYDFGALPAVTTPTIPNGTNFLNWRIFHKQRRCQSFQIVLTEVSGGTLGSGFVLSGINAVCGLKGSFRSISAAQSTS